MIDILFYILCSLAVLGALFILITKNVLYAACALVLTFLSVAGIYVIAGAEFLAVTQVMIYVGGIVVLMIFGVMLTNKISGKALITKSHNNFLGILAGAALCTLLIYSIYKINLPIIDAAPVSVNNIKTLGIGLMSDYILPFELAAVLLLLALIGAATIASSNLLRNDK